MGLIAERDGATGGYDAVPLPPAPEESGGRGATMLRRRSARTTKRAVLYLHSLTDSFVPDELATWYTERGFHFYVADLRPQARLDQPGGGRRGTPGLSECFDALDAMSGYLRDTESIDTVVVSAHAAGALIAALWCDARRLARPADALILAGPAFGRGRRRRAKKDRTAEDLATSDGGRLPGPLAGACRQLRRGLNVGCPVLVMCAAADWDAPEDKRRGKRGRRHGGGPGTTRLGPHVTWLRLADGLAGPLPPAGDESGPFFRELGRWLGAYLSGQFRDQLL